MGILTNRHDILVLFDVTNGNPNGDPDAGNMPRIDPTTNRGFVSDVCLKRKVRNFVEAFPPTPDGDAGNKSGTGTGSGSGSGFPRDPDGDAGNKYGIFVQQGMVLNKVIESAADEATKLAVAERGELKGDKKDDAAKKTVKWLCRNYFDIRTFGAVLSTGEKMMRGSAFGQLRGPVQVSFAQSFHPITPLEITVTRCAVTKEEDAAEERTFGHKHIVPYALYSAKVYVSPVFAKNTGFSTADLDVFFAALANLFEHDRSAARAEMVVRRVYDFEHVGTQVGGANADQNAREARLGCEHAHKLFEGVRVALKAGREAPESFADYEVSDAWPNVDSGGVVVPGVCLHRRVA